MIDFITGKPRTGKSYRAMKYILDNFFDEKKTPPYRYILTNIGGFQFDYLNKKFDSMGRDNKAYKMFYKDFLVHVTIMHKMAFDGKEDEELLRYADYHKINNSLIVLDEAMLYLKKLDEAMSWFFSYHGHFKVRIIVMCQKPTQVHTDYRIHTEFFIHAQDQSKQLRDNVLKYKHYDNPELKDSHFSDSIATNPEVYKLYKSGEIDKPKKILYKYIIIGSVLIFFLFFIFYLMFSRFSSHTEIDEISPGQNISPAQIVSHGSTINSSTFLLDIRCNENYCWNSDNTYEDNQISLSYFKYLVLKYELELQYSEVRNEIYKLLPAKKGYKKVTLAALTDYFYEVPVDLKTTYLARLFIPREPDIQTSQLFQDSPNILNNTANSVISSENNDKRGAPERRANE